MTTLEFGAAEVARGGVPELSVAEARCLAPDQPFLEFGRWLGFAVERNGEFVARLVASVDPRQRSSTGLVGCLGFVWRRAGDDAKAHSAGAVRAVLDAGAGWLRSNGATTIRCPVQLSTWYGHRAMTGGYPDEGGPPRLAFEPPVDRAIPALLEADGFRPAHRAVSCRVDSSVVVERTRRIVARFDRAGLRDRTLDPADLDGELRLLHRLAVDSFRGAWGIGDCTFEEFASIYRPQADGLDPALVRILHDGDGRPIGFALGMAAGPASDVAGSGTGSFVLKSIGVIADARRRHPGLGAAFTGMVHRAALERGYAAGIHALMAEDSVAHRITLHWGHPVRSYATFERDAR